jgi:hypothetical protein
MKPERMTQHLTDAAKRIGYKVRTEEGNFRGGSCVYAEERLIILNRRQSFEDRAELLARLLAESDLDSLYLLPEVRAYVEKFTSAPENA